jgi:drug/metabolite transporter (DMT)-like permease
MLSSKSKGIYLAFITAVVSGVSIFVNKFAVYAINPPLLFTATKNFYVGLLIVGIIFALGKWQLIKKLTKREIVYLVLIGIVGGSLPFYLFFTGLSQTSAINAALIQKTLVIWVAFLAVPFLKEKVSKTQILAVVLLFGSNLFVGGFKGFQFSQGELFILLATLLWAVETVLAKKILPTVDPDIVTGARMGLGSVLLLTAAAFTVPGAFSKGLALSADQWFWMIFTVVSLLAYVTSWYRALKFAPAITVSCVLVSSTLVTNILSAVFVTQSWNLTLSVQSLVMFVGILLVLEYKKYRPLIQ